MITGRQAMCCITFDKVGAACFFPATSFDAGHLISAVPGSGKGCDALPEHYPKALSSRHPARLLKTSFVPSDADAIFCVYCTR